MKICISMPAYNEADGISNFLDDLYATFGAYNPEVIVINDKSTDDTSKILQEYKLNNSLQSLEVVDCQNNLGHGRATILGLELALHKKCDFVIAIDGDGQFIVSQVLKALEIAISENFDVVEGVRTNRQDPKFRKIPTLGTKLLVFLAQGNFPKDANTPLRIYKQEFLSIIIKETPKNLLTPNIFISGASRILTNNYNEINLISTVRRGTSEKGTTWNQKFNFFPSQRFIKFCTLALVQYLKVIRPKLKQLKQTRY